MIWICGDTHGLQDIYKVQDYFEEIIVNTHVTKEDYLIILGDVAFSWDDGIHDERVREILHSLPCTVLWLDGNHENFDYISFVSLFIKANIPRDMEETIEQILTNGVRFWYDYTKFLDYSLPNNEVT